MRCFLLGCFDFFFLGGTSKREKETDEREIIRERKIRVFCRQRGRSVLGVIFPFYFVFSQVGFG